MNKRQKKKREKQRKEMRQQDPAIIRIAKELCSRRKKYIRVKWR